MNTGLQLSTLSFPGEQWPISVHASVGVAHSVSERRISFLTEEYVSRLGSYDRRAP